MLKSMTGYGRQRVETEKNEVTVEIKSVNHRYLDLNIKVPRIYAFLEEAIKSSVATQVSRGKIEIYVALRSKDGNDVRVTPNLPVIGGYITSLRAIQSEFGLKDDVSVMSVAAMQDALIIDREEPDVDVVLSDVQNVLADVLSEYNAMRGVEGQKLCEDILMRASAISKMVDKLAARSPQSVAEYKEKIAFRMTEILGLSEITEQRILSEAAVFADKICTTEEIVRLNSHLLQLDQMVRGAAAVGRKLDFLVQEINREANTIGSKCSDVESAQIVVEMKSEIEKIREQIQNLE